MKDFDGTKMHDTRIKQIRWRFLDLNEFFRNLICLVFTTLLQMLFVFVFLLGLVSCI